jgi:hypothetical protein
VKRSVYTRGTLAAACWKEAWNKKDQLRGGTLAAPYHECVIARTLQFNDHRSQVLHQTCFPPLYMNAGYGDGCVCRYDDRLTFFSFLERCLNRARLLRRTPQIEPPAESGATQADPVFESTVQELMELAHPDSQQA